MFLTTFPVNLGCISRRGFKKKKKTAKHASSKGLVLQVQLDAVTDFLLYAREGPRVIRMPKWNSPADGYVRNAAASHVVVVGGGLAGLSAVIEAQKAGATVTVIEKELKLGGNSAKATSGINGWSTKTQIKEKIPDEGKWFERDTFKSALGGNANAQLIQLLSAQSGNAVDWLIEELGVPLTVLSQLGGHAYKPKFGLPLSLDGFLPNCLTYVKLKSNSCQNVRDVLQVFGIWQKVRDNL